MKKLILIGLVIVLTACSAGSPNEFESNLQKWEKADISHYRYELFIGCFCIFTENMPLVIEVKDDEVVSMAFKNGAEINPDFSELFGRFATIDLIFAELEAGLGGEAEKVEVKYDETHGFPADIWFDYLLEAADDELGLTISGFEALP
jgi:hypothetical protein